MISRQILTALAWAVLAWAQVGGGRAPAFAITTDQGRQMTPSNFGGKLLVVNFWETACVPCVQELPSLADFARKFGPDGVVVLAISGDEDEGKYRAFLRAHHVALESYRDPSRHVARSFGTEMYPESYVIAGGRIVRKVVGGIDWGNTDMTAFVRARLGVK